MKKIIFRGPVQTASGYGVHARMLLKALDKSGKFDITVMSVPWGATPLIYEDTQEMRRIRELAGKFNPQAPGEFDASVQVTIPNEFMKMAPKNICVTAGIETDKVAKVWQEKSNEVADVVVVPSAHSARSFTMGIYGGEKGPNQVLLRKPLYVLPEWVNTDVFNTKEVEQTNDPLKDAPNFNFITVGLGMDKADGEDRKNISLLVKWFCEQFKGNQNVGLVLKVSMVNSSWVDFKNIQGRIKFIKQQAGCGQFPKITLIHGRLSDLELAALYKHPKVKAFVTTTHGEGFGLPIIEAAACGLPVLATNWSGHLDFLYIDRKSRFVPLDFDLAEIPQSCVWDGVLEKGTRWANVKETDVKMKMAKVVLSYDKPKEWAAELAKHISETFNDKIGERFAEDVEKILDDKPVQLSRNYLYVPKPSPKVLENVTLIAAGNSDHFEQNVVALERSMDQIRFAKTILFTDVKKEISDSRINVELIDRLDSVPAYDNFIAKKLLPFVHTSHVLNVQRDGYVLNGSAWDDSFLEYDYIGAPWFWDPSGMNGGFSLISKRLLEEFQSEEYPDFTQLDISICKKYRNKLEEKGFKFAPPDVAARFSVENLPYEGQFGWHGENPFYGER